MEKSPSLSPTASTNTPRSSQRRRLQYQDRIVEQPSSSFPKAAAAATTTIMSTYLTAESIRKVSPAIISANFGDKQVEKNIETISTVYFLFFHYQNMTSVSLFFSFLPEFIYS